MNTYNLISYDVWRDSESGWYVNNAFRTNTLIELPEGYTDKQLKQALYRSGYANKGVINAKIEVNHDCSECIYITLTGSRYGYKPFCELRLVKGDN